MAGQLLSTRPRRLVGRTRVAAEECEGGCEELIALRRQRFFTGAVERPRKDVLSACVLTLLQITQPSVDQRRLPATGEGGDTDDPNVPVRPRGIERGDLARSSDERTDRFNEAPRRYVDGFAGTVF